jgi:hypothetical protein
MNKQTQIFSITAGLVLATSGLADQKVKKTNVITIPDHLKANDRSDLL